MSKRLFQNVMVIASAACLAACGNKGELFLPAEVLLAQKLELVNVSTVESIVEVADDEVFDEQRQSNSKP